MQFDIELANKRFDEINITLSTQNLNIENLTQATSELSELQDNANDCVENAKKNIDALSALTESVKKELGAKVLDRKSYHLSQ